MNIGECIGNFGNYTKEEDIQGLISPNHNVGIEIELENFRYEFSSDSPTEVYMNSFYDVDNRSSLINPGKHWSIVRDNSLRNGVEFIFDGPKKGKSIIEAIEGMDAFLSKYSRCGRPAKASDRCSVHCHVDVRDLDEILLNRLLMIYVLVERVLFEYVSPCRLKNNYCRPITDSSFKHILNSINNSSNPPEINDAISVIRSQCDKYSALNLLPIQHYGTVEFRHHQGTTDMKKVLDWINILICIKLAASIPPATFISIYKSKGYKVLIESIFLGTVICEEPFISNPNLEVLIRKGINDYLEIINFNELKEKTNNKPSCSLSDDLLKVFINKNKVKTENTIKEKKYPPPLKINQSSDNLSNFITHYYNMNSIINQTAPPVPTIQVGIPDFPETPEFEVVTFEEFDSIIADET